MGYSSRARCWSTRYHDPSFGIQSKSKLTVSKGQAQDGQSSEGFQLTSQEQAEDVVYRAKFPPQGGRTSGGSYHTQAFQLDQYRTLTQEEYMKNANEATLIIAIIETKAGLENIDEIVQVKGLDAIFIGQYDLALSLGSLPQSAPEVINGVEKIFQSAKAAGIPVIAWSPGDEAQKAVEKGYEGIVVGLDMSILTKAFSEELKKAGAPQRW